jgi:hypothetical protein
VPDRRPGRPGLVIEASEFVQRRRPHNSKSCQQKRRPPRGICSRSDLAMPRLPAAISG